MKVLASGAVAVLALAGLALTQPVIQLRGAAFLAQVDTFPQTVYGQLFKGAWIAFLQHPFIGIGVGEYFDYCKPLEAARNLTYCDMHAHNTYLQLLSETGLVGAILLTLLALASLRYGMWNKEMGMQEKIVRLSALSGISVLFFPVIVTQSLFSNWPAALFWFSLALCVSLSDTMRAYAMKKPLP
jgi:O-antigen ligase